MGTVRSLPPPAKALDDHALRREIRSHLERAAALGFACGFASALALVGFYVAVAP